ncbi:MAG TPA: sugar transferase [Niabella sp.]|nr:sugar transferase [Agriterribacter sp.]HUN01321.1 sugar transferase [Niabella sp.]
MVLKEIFDRIAAFIGLILLLPAFIFIMVLMKIKMPGKIIFKQKRIGLNGRCFTMYKFRTMVENHSNSPVSVKGQPRITPLGAVLRKYKIDELPELYNVLIGDMSIVGPRPDVPGYADELKGDDRIILTFKPGITGLASLKYVNEEDFLSAHNNPELHNDTIIYPDKVKINKLYIKNWSFMLDIKIIFLTIFRNDSKINEIFKTIGYS